MADNEQIQILKYCGYIGCRKLCRSRDKYCKNHQHEMDLKEFGIDVNYHTLNQK